jgi:RNA polymerase sigma factor (sigma-70 family)
MTTHSWAWEGSEPETDQVLDRQINDGDPDSFERLYRRYYDSVLGHAVNLTRDRHSAMDLASEAFLRTWQRIREGKRLDRPHGYLFAVVRNLHIDSMRRDRRITFEDDLTELAEDHARSHAPDFSETLAERHSLRTAMGTMCPRQRAILWQTVVEGYSTSEVAAEHGAATANAGAQLAYRAKRTLRLAYASAN